MKTYISILAFFFLACSSNKQFQYDMSNCDFNDKILEKEKLLTIENLTNGDMKNDSIEIIFAKNSEDYSKYNTNKNNNITKRINYNKVSLKAINSYSFYEKGNFNIGNEYVYNDQGQVIKTIDHNQYSKYPICYKEIIKSTIKKAGSKFYFQGLERDSLIKSNQTEYSWKVFFASHRTKKFEIIKHKFFRIDAKTGKTITEEIVN
jgi:hypothetical protein